MVGSKTARRLFLSEFVNGTTVIHRISTVSGQIDLSWTVGGECELSSDGNHHLLLAATNELLKYDTDGRCMHRVAIGPECIVRDQRSLLLPDSMYHRSNFLCIHRLVRNFLPATERSGHHFQRYDLNFDLLTLI